MIRLANTTFLLCLIVIPLLVFAYRLYKVKQEKEWKAFAQNSRAFNFLHGNRKKLVWTSLYAFCILLICGIFALTNPQINKSAQEVEIESSDIFVALDISESMRTEDLKPNRLTRAKNLAQKVIEQLEGNRVGLILFAGDAYMYMPLTSDLSAAIGFVQAANTSMAPIQGTSISAAIRLANTSFDKTGDAGKSIIIISDGEDHEEDIDKAIKECKEDKVYIFTVSVGTDGGGYVPGIGRDNYLFDETGKPVKSVVNKKMLREIAEKSNATSYDLVAERNIDQALKRNIDQMEKQVTEVMKYANYDSIYQYFLLPIILLLLWQLFAPLLSYFKANKEA
jgi:Ca-activated chloride channel family protein